VRGADLVCVLHHGRITDVGTADAVFAGGGT